LVRPWAVLFDQYPYRAVRSIPVIDWRRRRVIIWAVTSRGDRRPDAEADDPAGDSSADRGPTAVVVISIPSAALADR
jgi:hypothetical protein